MLESRTVRSVSPDASALLEMVKVESFCPHIWGLMRLLKKKKQ